MQSNLLQEFSSRTDYFFPDTLLIKKIAKAIMPTTISTPTQTPAWKMSPTNSQLVNDMDIIKNIKT